MAQLQDVNTTDILAAIRLGCDTMCRLFNADDNDIPFFDIQALPNPQMSFTWAETEAHVPGRFLNALLAAEDAAGIAVAAADVEKLTDAALFAFSGPIPLPLNRQEQGGPLQNFLPHHIREGFHALCALAKFRASSRARELAEAAVDAIFRLWDPGDGWDHSRIRSEYRLTIHEPINFLNGLGRAIGPLVKYFRATAYGPALGLAAVLKEKAAEEYFAETGAFHPAHGAHCHSTTSTLSGLAQFADLTGDAKLLSRVKAFYDNGLWEIRDQIGWSIETTKSGPNYGRGEANNTGDILETALILGRWGNAEYYHDAERILRCHLLPSQLRDVSFIPQPANPENIDGKRDVARRIVGSFGLPAPYGHYPKGIEVVKFNTDIVGGVVGSLCEAHREAVRYDEAGHRVNLLFDSDTPDISVRSPYTSSALRVVLHRPGPLWVRLPPWAADAEVGVSGTREPRRAGDHLLFARPPVGQPVDITFPFAAEELTLNNPAGPIRVRLRGDAVTAMDNHGADLTFFDPID